MGQYNNNKETTSTYKAWKAVSITDSYTRIFYNDIFNRFKPSSKNAQDHQVDSLKTSMYLQDRFLDRSGSYH
jgi:hypothetical protein